MPRRLHRARLACLIALVASGCLPEVPTRELHDWELEVHGARAPVRLPAHLGHDLDRRAARYVLRTQLDLDQAWRGKDVTLAFPFLRTNLVVRANGHVLPPVDEPVFETARFMNPQRYRIPPDDTESGVVAVELEVDADWAPSSWWLMAPRLALGPYGDRWTGMVRLWNVGSAWISLVGLLTLAMVFWMLHITTFFHGGRRAAYDAKNTEFAKLAGGAALYPAVQLGLFQPILGRRDVALVIICMLVTVKASVQLTRKLVGMPPLPSWTAAGVAIMAVVLPFSAGGFMSPAWLYLQFAVISGTAAYIAIATIRRADRSNTFELRTLGAVWAIVLGLGAPDMFTGLGWGAPLGGIQLTCAALLIFVDVQAFVLARDHSRLLIGQAALNDQLARQIAEVEGRNREIEVLNEELRRKVGDRSRELSAALRKMRSDGESDLPAGAVLGDHYRVVARLGAGAMGAVYRVERLSDGRSLAAKVVRGRVRPDTLERFTREAELAARVDHPNVVRVFDVDVTSDGELFLVMELVEGRSLEDERARFGDRAFAEAMVEQIAGALTAIHGCGIVHRDLKPSNVLLSLDGGPRAKVADFGIAGFAAVEPPRITVSAASDAGSDDAVALDATIDAPPTPPASDPRLTQTGAIMGTPLYMAPEILRGTATIGPAADLFSLGLIAYQLFGGGSIERSGSTFRRAKLRTFADIAPGLDPAIAAALQRCVDEDPTLRPTARELSELFVARATRAAG